MRVVDHFPKHLPGVKLVCYDIGLSERQMDILKNKTHVISCYCLFCVYIYIFINLFVFSFLNLFIYLFIF